MSAKQYVLGLVDLCGKVVVAAAVRMQFLHQLAVGAGDVLVAGVVIQTEHGQCLGPRHIATTVRGRGLLVIGVGWHFYSRDDPVILGPGVMAEEEPY